MVALTGCARGGDVPAAAPGDQLRPTFPVETTSPAISAAAAAATGGGAAPPSTSAGAAGATAATTTPPPAATPAVAVEHLATASIIDPAGDLTPSPVDRPPAWADLVGATLTRNAEGFELRVRLGGAVPAKAADPDHTMNIASFYDVDGDGTIDYEVWATLADNGWGGSWFDNRNRTSRYAADAGVTWTPHGDELVMRFPLDHVGGAATFRWSLASEWGRYDVLSTPASARDDAPDNDRPAAFG